MESFTTTFIFFRLRTITEVKVQFQEIKGKGSVVDASKEKFSIIYYLSISQTLFLITWLLHGFFFIFMTIEFCKVSRYLSILLRLKAITVVKVQFYYKLKSKSTYTAKSFSAKGTCLLRRSDIEARNKLEGCFPPICILFSVNWTLKMWRKKDDVCNNQKQKSISDLTNLLEPNLKKETKGMHSTQKCYRKSHYMPLSRKLKFSS